MSSVEEMLSNGKQNINGLQVPEELEARLSNALQNKTISRRRINSWGIKIAVLVIAFVLVTYNIDTLAFYGRELLGFDGIMSGTLKELNKMGMGQTVEKSYTFSSGVKVTLNGIMIDDNQLLAFYTIENPAGDVKDIQFSSNYMKGAFGWHHQSSGQGQLSEDKRVIRWVTVFEPPYAFEKQLTWQFNISKENIREEGSISFVLDRDKAMGHTLKGRINKTVKVADTSIQFDTIVASPTSTIVKGTVQDIIELAVSKISGERIYSPSVDIRLLADGKEVVQQGWGASTDTKGMKFEMKYDALPRDLRSLQLHMLRFGAEHEVDEIVALARSDSGRGIQVSGQNIIIEKIEQINGETFITITTEDSVVLSRVYLLTDNKRIELTETIEGQRDKKMDGIITHARTLRFKAAPQDMKLEIKRIKYEQTCDEYIDIPIE